MSSMVRFELRGSHSTRWVWVLFVAAPLILGISFAPFVAHVSAGRELSREQLMAEMAQLAWAPSSIGFALILLATALVSRRLGIAMAELGWVRPGWKDLGLGLLVGVGLAAVCNGLVYPQLTRANPSFDPGLRDLAWPLAVGMFAVAALAEDTLYRGLGLGLLKQRFGLSIALLVSALFYSLLVPAQSWQMTAFGFVLGLVLGGLRLLTVSLWPVVIGHFVVSLSGKLLTYL